MTAPSAALASSSQPDQRFPKQARLRRRSEFLRVQGEGRRLHTPHFVVLLMPGRPQRFGVTVGKRIGCAVKRNRIKRVARELFRREKALFPADCEVVLVARTGAERLDYGAVKAELERAQASLARLLAGGPRPARGDGRDHGLRDGLRDGKRTDPR